MKLSRFENGWAEAALGAIYPGSGDGALTGIRSMDVPGFLGELLVGMPLAPALGLRIAVWIVALAPLFLMRRLTTICGLGSAEREALIARLVTSEWYAVRMLVMMLKAFGAMLYAADDAVRARILAPRPSAQLLSLRPKNVHAA